MNIVLYQPEIPQNTGNIARTCAATGSILHLIRPLGFSIDEKSVRRAGLDYWDQVQILDYQSWDDFLHENPTASMHFLSTKAPRSYADAEFRPDDFLVFGRETAGLPEPLLQENLDRCFRIPMVKSARSLNLANAVAVVLYEALRRNHFAGLLEEGAFPPTK